jgi:drug/metabolite transporter (DMT)-like permease
MAPSTSPGSVAPDADCLPQPGTVPSGETHLHLPWWMWIVPCIWAGAFLTGASALNRLSADTVSFLRFAVTVAGGALILRRPALALIAARPRPRQWLALLLLALTGGVLYHVLFYLGLARSQPPIAAVVIATNPMLTALGCAIFLRDRKPTAALFVGLTLAFLGAASLAADQPDKLGRDAPFLQRIVDGWGIGETLCLFASIAWAIFAVLMQHFRGGVLKELPSAGVTYFVYAMTAAILAPCIVVSGSAAEIPTMSAGEWGCMLYIGVIATVIAYTMYNAAIDRVGSARVSQVTYAVPTLTTLLSIAFLGFVPGTFTAVGLVLVTAGLIVSDGRVVSALRLAWRGTPRR